MCVKRLQKSEMKLYNSAVADGMEKGLKKGRKEGRKEGREEGRKEGREEGNISAQCKIVEHMHSVGMDEQEIVRCSGVSAEVVAKILRGIYK